MRTATGAGGYEGAYFYLSTDQNLRVVHQYTRWDILPGTCLFVKLALVGEAPRNVVKGGSRLRKQYVIETPDVDQFKKIGFVIQIATRSAVGTCQNRSSLGANNGGLALRQTLIEQRLQQLN